MKLTGIEEIIHHDPEDPSLKQKERIVLIFIISGFLILLLRIWYIQVFRGGEFKRQAIANSIRRIEADAPRGRLIDRFGRIVAENRPTFNVSIVLEDINYQASLVKSLGDKLKINPYQIEERINLAKQKGLKRFQPITIAKDISWEQLSRIKVNQYQLPGVYVYWKPTRYYPFKEMSAHLIGHIGEADENDLKLLRSYKIEDYTLGDFVGKSGLEESMEMVLKGKKGQQIIEVDAQGREIKSIQKKDPLPGADLELTIDLDLQIEVRDIMKDKVGVIIAEDPQTGEILAYQNSPAYDPNFFTVESQPDEWLKLIEGPEHPLEDRGIRGLYPPGSTFKVVLAAAAIEEGISTENSYYCNGAYRFGNRVYNCWKGWGHGRMDLFNAIVNSCDVYFYQLGLTLGMDAISKYAKKMGLMQPTGIGIKGEKTGLIPDGAWKTKILKEPWYPGETLSFSIGQGYTVVTPVQLLKLYEAIANEGKVYAPMIVKRVVYPGGEVLKENTPEVLREIDIKKSTFKFIKNALKSVVMDTGGTGRSAFVQGYEVAGKTGTSQVVSSVRGKPEDLPYNLRDHALFVGFSPVEKPRILVVAIVEHGGSGGKVAAPLVGKVIKRFWDIQKERELRNIKFIKNIGVEQDGNQIPEVSQ